ncbi:MAG: nuclear transport factor 2 family protein [Flavobacteriaceae bacterium]|nr:nuclear transport factor 2 family protein [Flavobacteriaceae bacterium]
MKKLIILLTIPFFFACDDSVVIDEADMSGTISATDKRNEIANTFADAYEKKDKKSALSIFAEDAVFYVNDSKLNPSEVVDGFMTGHEYYNDIKNTDRTITTMFYNNGDVYTNYWYTWNGINKSTGELLSVRGYAYFKWDGLKVIEAYNAFDPTEYLKAFEQ